MVPIDGLSQQRLSDTIGLIYDCALDTELWPMTLGRLAELGSGPFSGIAIHDLRGPDGSRVIEHGYPKAFCEVSGKYWDKNPMTPGICLLEVGAVDTLCNTCSEEELAGSVYHREVQMPFGIHDIIGVLALRNGNRIGYVHAARCEDAPRFGERDIELFKLLSPHICRSLAISDALDLKTLRSEMLEDALNGLATAVYLTNRDGRIAYLNRTAEDQLRKGTAMCLIDGRLAATDPQARAALAVAIERISAKTALLEEGGHAMAIPDRVGGGYVATLLPLESGMRSGVMAAFASSVAVFVQNPTQAPHMPGEAFARLYGLTAGELRVLLALAQGLGALESAHMLGLSEATVRTHLRNMFAKTGTSRQAELLQLLQNAASPVQ